MPLRKGQGQEIVSANIAELIDAGYSREMAIAISMDRARKVKPKGKKKGK